MPGKDIAGQSVMALNLLQGEQMSMKQHKLQIHVQVISTGESLFTRTIFFSASLALALA